MEEGHAYRITVKVNRFQFYNCAGSHVKYMKNSFDMSTGVKWSENHVATLSHPESRTLIGGSDWAGENVSNLPAIPTKVTKMIS